MASKPTPKQAMISSFGQASMSSAEAPSTPLVAMARISGPNSLENRARSSASHNLWTT